MIIDFFGNKVHAPSDKGTYVELCPKPISDEIYKRLSESKPVNFLINKDSFTSMVHFGETVNPAGIVYSDFFFDSQVIPFPDVKLRYSNLINHFESRVHIFTDYRELVQNTINSPIDEYVCIGVMVEDFSHVKGFSIGTSVFFPIIVSPDCKFSGTNLFGFRGNINSKVKKEGYLSSYRDESTDSIMSQWIVIQFAAMNPFGFDMISTRQTPIGKAKKGQPQRYNTTYAMPSSLLDKAQSIAEKAGTQRISGYWRDKKFVKGYWKNVPSKED